MVMTTSTLVPLTIWTALLLYTCGEYGRTHRPAAGWSRPAWSLGAAVYLAHVAAAFDAHHGWSHAAAYAYTAAQTEAFIGLDWGGGVWVNYAFTLMWVADAVWWGIAPVGYRQRARAIDLMVRAVFLFMIVNGAVVFVEGVTRWLGVGIVAALVWIWSRPPEPRP